MVIWVLTALFEVKKEYEIRTGEQMIPMEEWSDDVQQKFFELGMQGKTKEFVDYVLGDVSNV